MTSQYLGLFYYPTYSTYDLNGMSWFSSDGMYIQYCFAICLYQNYSYAGLYYGYLWPDSYKFLFNLALPLTFNFSIIIGSIAHVEIILVEVAFQLVVWWYAREI